jgi:hypothetical protein
VAAGGAGPAQAIRSPRTRTGTIRFGDNLIVFTLFVFFGIDVHSLVFSSIFCHQELP